MDRTAAASTHNLDVGRRLASHGLSAICLLLVIMPALAKGQSSAEVRQAFGGIHDDRVPLNCVHATSWLFQHREQLKGDLLDELYRTDRQGRDAILHVLFNTSSFAPDERFARVVIARLPEQDSHIPNNSVFEIRDDEKDLVPIHTWGAHWEAWLFMNKHFAIFEPLLREQIAKTKNVFVLWGTAWLFKKRGVLKDYSTLFTPAILDSVAANLRADKQPYNASHAVRLFLLLGDQSLPALRKAASSTDQQTHYLANATIDALTKGSHDAFGYLSANLNLIGVPFGDQPPEPSWLSEAMEKYRDRDTYP
jgi:hypothetical protein